MSSLRLGVIGYGLRVQHILNLIIQAEPDATVVAITDIRNDSIREQMQSRERDVSQIAFFEDADAMLDQQALDGVLVGTRCDLHAQMARKVMARNLPLFLEKPVATRIEDLRALYAAAAHYTAPAVVSFPLRVSPLVRLAKEIIDSGKLGTVEHVQAWNNVPYGSVYYQDWYRDETVTQGLFLQKATHDFDYLNFLIGLPPRWISAMTSKQVFRGDHPAGLHCAECPEQRVCPESPSYADPMRSQPAADTAKNPKCAFAVDTGNEDSGSALVQYASGMHLVYSQNFFARNKAAKRGATLLGYKGTLEFDWYTDTLKVFMHHTPRVETYDLDMKSVAHGGGDAILAENFVRVIRREAPSVAPLEAGLMSALMCIKAKEAAATRTFQEVRFPVSAPAKTEGRRELAVLER